MEDRMHTHLDIPYQETPHHPRSPPRPPPNPLLVRATERFPTFTYLMLRYNPNAKCLMCTNPFEEGTHVTLLLPCKQYIHRECLAGMLAAHRCCALCRTEMDLENGLRQVELIV